MDPVVVAAIIAAGTGVLTVVCTLYGTHRTVKEQLAEQRHELDRTLNERFATAAGQLGDDKRPAVRLAGVYAMAGLADDWPENRQTCVDILCAYLRLPYDPDPGDKAKPADRADYQENREVRHTIIRLIGHHLGKDVDSKKSWQGLNLVFTGVVFDGGDFRGARFSGGQVSFAGVTFSSGSQVSFIGARIGPAGEVDFGGATFSSGSEVDFGGATFSSGSLVYFVHAAFSGGRVVFLHARFCGGQFDFSAPRDWSHPPLFDGHWENSPPGVTLPVGAEAKQA